MLGLWKKGAKGLRTETRVCCSPHKEAFIGANIYTESQALAQYSPPESMGLERTSPGRWLEQRHGGRRWIQAPQGVLGTIQGTRNRDVGGEAPQEQAECSGQDYVTDSGLPELTPSGAETTKTQHRRGCRANLKTLKPRWRKRNYKLNLSVTNQ